MKWTNFALSFASHGVNGGVLDAGHAGPTNDGLMGRLKSNSEAVVEIGVRGSEDQTRGTFCEKCQISNAVKPSPGEENSEICAF